MLSDEEKKATVELNHFSNITAYWKKQEYTNSEIDNYIKIVLNLIENQQKEIEELKKYEEGYKLLSYSLENYISKDKIKAKIEELEKLDFGTGLVSQFTANLTTITILQSLLEED